MRRIILKMEDFETFYNKQQKKLLPYLIRITGDYSLSMDILQESFTKYLEKYAKETRNVSLLYTIARNNFIDYKRKAGRDLILEHNHKDPSKNQGENLQINQECMLVLEAMKGLKDDEREIMALVITEDLSYEEIASLVGTTRANVKVKVHRARIKLREILKTGGLL